jgi:hypothetical protein
MRCLPTDRQQLMPPDFFLHEHPEFEELIRIVAENIEIHPVLVEKDYWIMHCLHGLNRMGLTFELKGGTSLSKGFKVIDRFSEDIDIRIDPECAPFDVFCGKNHSKEKHIKSRKIFYDWLAKVKLNIAGIREVNRDHEFDDEKYRSGGIRLIYESLFEPLTGVSSGILLEAGFDATFPNMPVNIGSWALEYAQRKHVEVTANMAVQIKCYLPEYTFVEKLQTISTKFRQQQERGSNPAPFMRHYYDVGQLLQTTRVQDFIGTDEYTKHKQNRFRAEDEPVLAKNEAFLLSDKNVKKLYRDAYEQSSGLYYKEQPSFDGIIRKIHKYISKL